MNPYKKIRKLEHKVTDLKAENNNLRLSLKEMYKIQSDCDIKCKAAEARAREYQTMTETLRKERESYQKLLHSMKFIIDKNNRLYKKALHEIKKDYNF